MELDNSLKYKEMGIYVEKEEIFRYIVTGSCKSISVNRCLLNAYPGIMRDIVIQKNNELQINFLDKDDIEMGEGEITFYFCYKSYEELFKAIEDYIRIKMINWENYTKTNRYPDTDNLNLEESWRKFKNDFVNKKIAFPKGYKEFRIASLYWQALYSGEVKPNDSIEIFHQWVRNKMK